MSAEHAATVVDLRARLDSGDVTAVELAEERIRATEESLDRVNAFVEVYRDEALDEARASDERLRSGKRLSVLDGIPFGVKDVIHVAGHVLLAGSRSVGLVPEVDATIVAQLRRAGAVILGSTRLHELAYGPSGLNEHDGGARNPRYPEFVPGGSSSGSAAAVAAGLVPVALGSDTGGSIRGPATLCGVVGFKPSYGLLSTDGVLPTAPTLDHLGLLTQTVEDAQSVMEVLTGQSFGSAADADSPRRLAVFADPDVDVDSAIADALDQVVHRLARGGWTVDTVVAPRGIDVMAVSTTIMSYEAYRGHKERLAAVPELIGADVRRRLQDGALVTTSQYEAALDEARELRSRMTELMAGYDALVNATIPIAAPRASEAAEASVRRQLVRNTRLQDVLGAPAVSLPGPRGPMPWGIQLFSPPGSDAALLAAAAAATRQLR